MKEKLILGSRGSRLALWQTRYVAHLLQSFYPSLQAEIEVIETVGDRILDTALSKIGDKGLFTKQIEEKLLNGEIDLAVHSLKDLPTTLPANLKLGAVTDRETPNDAFVSPKYKSLDDLPGGARIATGSLRRRSQLLAYRPDLEIVEIRGNVPTRLKKMEDAALDGMILAAAGLQRLGLESEIKQIVPFDIMLPAVAQGVIGIEIRETDSDTQEILRALNDDETESCILAERAFLRSLEGGCQVPIGGHARIENGEIVLEGFVGSAEGMRVMRDRIAGSRADAEILGIRLAEKMIAGGANDILNQTRREAESAQKKVF